MRSKSLKKLNHLNPFFNVLYFRVEVISVGNKRMAIRTSILEEKATACSMLCCYAEELKEGFFPWIDEVESCHTSEKSL